MDRTERFYKIEMLIRSRGGGGSVSFAELMAELGVSRATLKRDLEYLRSRMNAPIVYDRPSNGYRFAAPAEAPRSASPAHELPGLWFSEGEIHALLTMHQLIQGLDEGGVLARHLQPLLERLHGMLGTSESESRELMRRVKIASPARRPVTPRHFELIGSALTRRQRVHMNYFVRSRQEDTERVVSPQRLVHYRSTWYLDAWCHHSERLRRFALDAVRQVRLLEQRARDVGLRTVESELDAGYGIFGGAGNGKPQWATLRFTPEAAQWVRHEQWHPAQEAVLEPDGALTLKLPYAEATELVMDVLRHGEQVRVLRPASLAALVAQRLKEAASQYSAA
ncbi:helix-turn-helix transcriptional regulator [Azohydromonas caseinilytica]|uniref:WYL domain-containing protein n=1 Tax=Azohydromonas caseinilytica TaxID=2728836 RepID=A0A848F8R3_9BURK|nr:WYL domain-containing protein [Azohydromonas caseinilytica]NML15618.1 WYL domain-containing protein [Azohydromonas caseinilytica]